MRRIPDVNVGAGRGAPHGSAEGNKGNPGISKVSHDRLPLGAIRVNGYVNGIPMIKSQVVVNGGLSVCAHRKRQLEPGGEKALDLCDIGKCPAGGTVETNQGGGSLVGPGSRRQLRELALA